VIIQRIVQVLLLLALSAVPVAALAEDPGITAYTKGDYAKAYAEFKAAAERGDLRGQYNLGVLYFTGRGVRKDLERAVEWYRRAAAQGLAVAQSALGLSYYRGDGVEQNYAQARKWFGKAAEQGLAWAQYNLGVMYFNGEGVDKDMDKVVHWIGRAARRGFPDAQYRFGMMYEKGSGVAADSTQALSWYQKAAGQGHGQAAERVAALGSDLGTMTTAVGPQTVETTTKPAPGIETKTAAETAAEIPAGGTEPQPPANAGNTPAATPKAPKPPLEAKKPVAKKARKTAAGGARAWHAQLASYRTGSRARKAWVALQKAYPDLLGGFAPTIQEATLKARGTFFRVLAGPVENKAAALGLCRQIKQRQPKQGCIAVRHAAR
jgi:TPR repeat protein